MDKARKRPQLLNLEGLLSIYNENMQDAYKQIVSVIPKDGGGKYYSMCLATKLLEKDESVMEIVKASLATNVVNKIENILNQVKW